MQNAIKDTSPVWRAICVTQSCYLCKALQADYQIHFC